METCEAPGPRSESQCCRPLQRGEPVAFQLELARAAALPSPATSGHAPGHIPGRVRAPSCGSRPPCPAARRSQASTASPPSPPAPAPAIAGRLCLAGWLGGFFVGLFGARVRGLSWCGRFAWKIERGSPPAKNGAQAAALRCVCEVTCWGTVIAGLQCRRLPLDRARALPCLSPWPRSYAMRSCRPPAAAARARPRALLHLFRGNAATDVLVFAMPRVNHPSRVLAYSKCRAAAPRPLGDAVAPGFLGWSASSLPQRLFTYRSCSWG